MTKQLSENISVSPQIPPSDVEIIAKLGFDAIMCNRPDNEEPGQPSVAEIEAQAKANGLEFYHVSIQSGQVTPEAISAFSDALENSKKLFAYCRTGTRSAMLWSLSQKGNLSVDDILEATSKAGYDFSALRAQLEA